MIDETAFVHPMALVEGSTVGARTRIWQFASVIRGARIGADCNIASGACIDGSVVGDGSIICHNLAAGPGFNIGADVFIGPNCTLCNDAWPRADKTGFNPAAFNGKHWAIIIGDCASVGANSVILPGVVIGQNAMVAAGSVVTKDVPRGMLWMRDGSLREVPGDTSDFRMRFARDQYWAERVA